jgi:hypothetical protein
MIEGRARAPTWTGSRPNGMGVVVAQQPLSIWGMQRERIRNSIGATSIRLDLLRNDPDQIAGTLIENGAIQIQQQVKTASAPN